MSGMPPFCVVYVVSFLVYNQSQSGFLGIQLPHRVAKVSAYAVDLLFFSCRDQKDVNRIFSFFAYTCIKQGIGNEFNLNRTQLLAMGDTSTLHIRSDYLVYNIKVCGVIFPCC